MPIKKYNIFTYISICNKNTQEKQNKHLIEDVWDMNPT